MVCLLTTDGCVFVAIFDEPIYFQQPGEGQGLLVVDYFIKIETVIGVLTHHVPESNKPEQIVPFSLLALWGCSLE